MNGMLNGVNVMQLAETVEAIKGDPSIARFEFRVANRWIGGGENRSTVDGYYGAKQEMRRSEPFEIVNDEPPVLLGADRGANPVEHYLNALAGCLTTSMIYHAAQRGIAVKAVSARLVGELDLRGFLGLSDDVRKGFHAIRVEFDVDGELTDAEKEELMSLASFSPVYDMVRNGVSASLSLKGAATRREAA